MASENTLEQNKPFIKRLLESSAKFMQVIFIRKCHWACILLNENQVSLYDSAYTSVSTDTFRVVARLVQCVEPSFKIEVMNISKQSGAVDCGLYAIAVLTSLAFGQDPTTLVYDQEAMRPHLITSFETKKIVPFPVLKHRRPADKVAKLKNAFCIATVGCLMMDMKWFAVICVMHGITKLVLMIRIVRMVPGYAHTATEIHLFNELLYMYC